jgi:branched-chain amino acid transport system substrate-binding protein
MIKKWLGASLFAVAIAIGGLSTSVESRAEDDPIVIGFAIAKSGYMAAYDLPATNGAILKIEEINAAGGLLGRQIEYKIGDMKTDAALSAKVGAELVADGVDFLVTDSDYDLGAPAALAALKEGVVAFATGAADPKMGVQGVGWQTFTGNGAAQLEGIDMAEWAYHDKGLRTAAVLEDKLLEYNKSGCAGFRAAWKQLAGDAGIVSDDSFMNSDPSIASQISRIRAADPQPDAIFMCSLPPGGASAVRQIRAAGIDVPILGTVGMTGDFWLDAVPNLTNFFNPTPISVFGDDPDPTVKDFTQRYEERFGQRVPMAYAVFGYLIVEAWTTAVERAGTTDAKAVVAQLEQYKEEPLILPTTFTSELHIQTQRPLLIEGWDKGNHLSIKRWRNQLVPDMALLFRVGQ